MVRPAGRCDQKLSPLLLPTHKLNRNVRQEDVSSILKEDLAAATQAQRALRWRQGHHLWPTPRSQRIWRHCYRGKVNRSKGNDICNDQTMQLLKLRKNY